MMKKQHHLMTIITWIIIIGGGLAGLAAAVRLETKNVPYVLLESSDGFGGRARTDIVGGYILDRGFAIYLSSYEECNRIFDTSRRWI